MWNRTINAAGLAACVLLAAAASSASDLRRVAALHFTAVSCGPCGGAALAMERLKSEVGDSLCVIGVHYYDLYKIPEAETLAAFYGVVGTPTTWFDGVDVQYYQDTATYWGYRYAFDKRKSAPPLAGLALSGWADTTERVGQLTCAVSNPMPDTLWARLRVAVIERAIYRPWGGGDSVFDVMRGMLPGFNGPQLLLPSGADTSFTFPFSISPNWDAGHIEFMAWAEGLAREDKAPSRAILQSERISLGQLAGVASVSSPKSLPRDILSADIRPNPLRGRGSLRFMLSRPGRVTAGFYGIDGRRLRNMDLGWRGAGEHRIVVDAGSWAAGTLFCVLKTNSVGLTIKVNKLN